MRCAAFIAVLLAAACSNVEISESGAECRVVRPSTRTVEVPDELRACTSDAECKVIQAGCCFCTNAEVPARADAEETLRDDYEIGCVYPVSCPTVVDPCHAEASRCVDGRCELCGVILD